MQWVDFCTKGHTHSNPYKSPEYIPVNRRDNNPNIKTDNTDIILEQNQDYKENNLKKSCSDGTDNSLDNSPEHNPD